MYHNQIGYEGVKLIHLDQYGDKWWAYVNTVMKLRISYDKEILGHLIDYLVLKKDSTPWS
jgi:hypothetical protein